MMPTEEQSMKALEIRAIASGLFRLLIELPLLIAIYLHTR